MGQEYCEKTNGTQQFILPGAKFVFMSRTTVVLLFGSGRFQFFVRTTQGSIWKGLYRSSSIRNEQSVRSIVAAFSTAK